MARFVSRLPSRGKVFRTLTILTILVAVAVVVTSAYVYYEAVRTFEVRRVSLPSRVYTDSTPLAAGATLSEEAFQAKLGRLGYREEETIAQPGAYRRAEGGWEVHLRGFEHPAGKQEARRVRLAFEGGKIASLDEFGSPSAGGAALEPELLTSIMGERLENRSPVTLEAVPPHLIDAVIVTEDVRFFTHPGVDPVGIGRALWRNLRSGGASEGGSTLTQQLVKNYYLTNERTLRRKTVEAFMALILDAKYSKEEILEAYINDIYLGRNRSISILGVGQAARFYFGKPVTELSIAESALLAGLIPSPNNYSPFENPERATARRETVLKAMVANDKITREQFDEALASPLPEEPSRERTNLGSIPYYVDRVLQEARRDYGIEEIASRGLNIYTAIDLEWQAAATRELQEGLERLERSSRRLRREESPLQGAIIGIDVETAEIRALVGGRSYEQSQFNRATSAKRQVGSLFKPFVFLAAFEPSLSNQNITPATLVNDERFVLERRFAKDWSPRNYEGSYHGVVTVRQALEKSLNAASVRLGLSAGTASIIRTANALGINTPIDNNPAMILGAVEVPPIEMAEAYTTMARMGSRLPLKAIRWVADENGNAVSSAEANPVQVFPARDVYLAVHLMEGVVDRGTAGRVRAMGFRKTAAGKTGTTNDKRDSWFIGFTPRTLGVAWIGFDDNNPVGISGSEGAVPLWTRFMTRITSEEADSEFRVPGGIIFEEVDASTGGRATELCPRNEVVSEAFKVGTQPMQECPIHQPPQPAYVDAWGMPILGPDGLPMTDPYYDPAYVPPPAGTGEPMTPAPAPTTTTERPEPVLGGGSFPSRGTTSPPPTDTRAPRPLPAPLPERPQPPTPEPPAREPSRPAEEPPPAETKEPPPPQTEVPPPDPPSEEPREEG
jgi:penicillin-binding protein 1B